MCFAPSFLRSPGGAVTRISEPKHRRIDGLALGTCAWLFLLPLRVSTPPHFNVTRTTREIKMRVGRAVKRDQRAHDAQPWRQRRLDGSRSSSLRAIAASFSVRTRIVVELCTQAGHAPALGGTPQHDASGATRTSGPVAMAAGCAAAAPAAAADALASSPSGSHAASSSGRRHAQSERFATWAGSMGESQEPWRRRKSGDTSSTSTDGGRRAASCSPRHVRAVRELASSLVEGALSTAGAAARGCTKSAYGGRSAGECTGHTAVLWTAPDAAVEEGAESRSVAAAA
eukprot:6348393-Prymnesium_polylepis.2